MNEAEKKAQEANLEKIREVVKQRNTDRISRMEEIADNKEEAEEEQMSDMERAQRATGEKREAAEPDDKEAAAAEEDRESERYARALQEEGIESVEPVQEDSDEKTVNGEKYYRQIVNGVEKWQTLKEIRQTAQKVSSADEYLRTASEGARKAAELALSPRDETGSLDEDETQKLLAAAILGDEESTKKLASAIARLSRQDISQAIDQRVSFRTELSRLEEKSEDLLKDPYMGRLFRSRINELKEENPTMRISEAYTSIDAELRGAFPGFKGSKLQEKIERKRTLPVPPNAATRAGTAVEEEEPEDVSRDIAEMAKARGKTPYFHGPQRRS